MFNGNGRHFLRESIESQRSGTTSVLRGLTCHLVDPNELLMVHVRKGGKQFKDEKA